jgi:hypothetical protein
MGRIRDVCHHAGGLRWTIIASTPDLETFVHVDTTEGGSVFDIQSDSYAGTSGDDELDWLVKKVITDTVSLRFFARILRVAETFARFAGDTGRSVPQPVFRSGRLRDDFDLAVFGAEVIQSRERTD